MHSKNGKHNFSVTEPSDSKIEPAFRITRVLGTLGVTGSPYTIMIVAIPHNFTEIARIELTVEIYVLLMRVRFVELHSGVLRNR